MNGSCIIVMVALNLFLSGTSLWGAVTVDFIAQPGQRFVVDANGEPLRSGTVEVGTFAADFDPAVEGLSASELRGAWTGFGQSAIRSLAGERGRFSDSVSGDGASLSGRKIYLWISTGVAADENGGYAIFSSADARWQFPVEGTPPPSNSTLINSNDITEVIGEGSIEASFLRLDGFIGASAYDAWVVATFPDGAGVDETASDVDADTDGWSNAFEFLMGTSPLDKRDFPRVIANAVEGNTTISFSMATESGGTVDDLAFESSSDLMNWVRAVPREIESSNGDGRLVARFVQDGQGAQRFYRMVANLD